MINKLNKNVTRHAKGDLLGSYVIQRNCYLLIQGEMSFVFKTIKMF